MLMNLLKFRKGDPQRELKEALKGYVLPSFPASVMNVINLLRNPDVSVKEIAPLIQSDPGMHVLVLKTVNSAAFGLNRKVGNVLHAVTLLGRSRLESLVLPLGVKSAIPNTGNNALDSKTFWLTNARRACLAERIAGIVHPATRIEAFTAGLLQDMAIPVMGELKKKEYGKVFDQWNQTRDFRLDQAEKKSCGFDHQTVGGLMASEWNLPEHLVQAISCHHLGESESVDPAVRLVAHLHYAKPSEEPALAEAVALHLSRELSMSRDLAQKMVDESFRQAGEFAALMH